MLNRKRKELLKSNLSCLQIWAIAISEGKSEGSLPSILSVGLPFLLAIVARWECSLAASSSILIAR